MEGKQTLELGLPTQRMQLYGPATTSAFNSQIELAAYQPQLSNAACSIHSVQEH
jgi:hypothetical protein